VFVKYLKLFEDYSNSKNLEQLFLENGFDRNDIKEIALNDAIKLTQLSDVKDVGEWLDKPIDEIKYYYKEEPISIFIDTIEEMESTYDEFVDELNRTEHIVDLLENGNKPMAIFIELNDKDNFIMEGRHRIVAFSWFGLDKVPVIYVK
jgi:hypothetical protein